LLTADKENNDMKAALQVDQGESELLDAIERVTPVLMEQAQEDDAGRTLSATTVEALRETRVSMLKAPAEVGGYDADPMSQMRVLEKVAYASPAAGWVAFVHADAGWLAGSGVSDEAAKEIFADDPMMAIVGMPGGSVRRVQGGYRLNGRWSYASGSRHADFVLLHAIDDVSEEPESNEPFDLLKVKTRWTIVPAGDLKLVDNWYSAHLPGTGSGDVEVEDAFVPEGYTVAAQGMRWEVQRGDVSHRLPMQVNIAPEHLGFALGLARRALDEARVASVRRRSMPGAPVLADRGAFQREFGRSDLELLGAWELSLAVLQDTWGVASEGGELDAVTVAKCSATVSHVTQVCCDLALRVHRYLGSSVTMPLGQPIQRVVRDLIGATQHIATDGRSIEEYARFALHGESASAG
jgi:alkylation response protein AidB-like acyl-CoA dehydrogenase